MGLRLLEGGTGAFQVIGGNHDLHASERGVRKIDVDVGVGELPRQLAEGQGPVFMPSHSVGMVGLTKRLIDHTARKTAAWAQPDAVGEGLEIDTMTVWDGIVALRKPNA